MLRNFGISLFLVAHVVAAQDVWKFSSILGGVGFDSAVDVGGDLDGNTYIAGISSSEGEPFTRAAPNVGRRRGYLMKLDTGGQLVYLRFFNGEVAKLFVLPNRDVLVAGSSAAVDFETTAGAFQTTVDRDSAFLARVNAAGELMFATRFGYFGSVRTRALSADSQGNPVLCGTGGPSDIPGVESGLFPGATGAVSAFCAYFNADGSKLLYSTLLDGTREVTSLDSAVFDADDNLLVSGITLSNSFPETSPEPARDVRKALYRFNPEAGTWEPLGSTQPGTTVQSIQFAGNTMIVSTENRLAASDDDGATWRTAGEMVGQLAVHPLNPQYLCARTPSGQASCSRNGGETWQILDNASVSRVVADPKHGGGFYVLRSNYLGYISLKDLRGGPSFLNGTVSDLAVDQQGNQVWLVSPSSSSLYRSQEGGPFERIAQYIDQIRAAPSSPSTLYGRARQKLPGRSRFIRSDDAGTTWFDLSLDFDPAGPWDFRVDPSSAEILYVLANQRLYRSVDGGMRFEGIEKGLTNRAVRTMEFDPAGRLLVGTDLGGRGFLMKIDLKNRRFVWSRLLGGSGGTGIFKLNVAADRRIWVMGSTYSTDLPGADRPPDAATFSYFVGRFDEKGATEWLRYAPLGMSRMDRDGTGRIHLAGFVPGPVAFAEETLVRESPQAFGNLLWLTLDADGSRIANATCLGTGGNTLVNGFAVGPDGLARIVGSTSSPSFWTTTGAWTKSPLEGQQWPISTDGFVSVASLP